MTGLWCWLSGHRWILIGLRHQGLMCRRCGHQPLTIDRVRAVDRWSS